MKLYDAAAILAVAGGDVAFQSNLILNSRLRQHPDFDGSLFRYSVFLIVASAVLLYKSSKQLDLNHENRTGSAAL
jgi:hypothetical protein